MVGTATRRSLIDEGKIILGPLARLLDNRIDLPALDELLQACDVIASQLYSDRINATMVSPLPGLTIEGDLPIDLGQGLVLDRLRLDEMSTCAELGIDRQFNDLDHIRFTPSRFGIRMSRSLEKRISAESPDHVLGPEEMADMN